MNGLWRSHVERAVDLLNQAQVAANTTAGTRDYLYDAVVAITYALTELERPKEETEHGHHV